MVITLLYILFVLSAIVLITVVLLQEGKGGGFGAALGSAGQQTFGVKAQGIHKFTGGVAVVFLMTALVITILNGRASSTSVLNSGSVLDTVPADSGGAGAGGGNAQEGK